MFSQLKKNEKDGNINLLSINSKIEQKEDIGLLIWKVENEKLINYSQALKQGIKSNKFYVDNYLIIKN